MIEPSVDYSGSGGAVGDPVQPCHPDDPTPTLTSETYVSSPADRARLRVGVGEQVTLTYAPSDATWTIAGDGAISFGDGDDPINAITFTAGDTAGSVTITATGQYGACSLTFEVVAPASLTLHKVSGTPLKHTQGMVENGFMAYIYLHPNDVNFYRVRVREKDSRAVGTGSCAWTNGRLHGEYRRRDPAGGENVGPWMDMVNHTEAWGTNTLGTDQVYLGQSLEDSGSSAPFHEGTVHLDIVNHWIVVGKTRVNRFPVIHQDHHCTTDGRCQSRKASENRTSNFDDPTTSPDFWL